MEGMLTIPQLAHNGLITLSLGDKLWDPPRNAYSWLIVTSNIYPREPILIRWYYKTRSVQFFRSQVGLRRIIFHGLALAVFLFTIMTRAMVMSIHMLKRYWG